MTDLDYTDPKICNAAVLADMAEHPPLPIRRLDAMPTTQATERPILFNGDMVRAILDGRKTQTRRPVKPQPTQQPDGSWMRHARGRGCYSEYSVNRRREEVYGKGRELLSTRDYELPVAEWLLESAPYSPGDRLWVRETWTTAMKDDAHVFYRADETDHRIISNGNCWRPSIHMPRAASRLLLEVTEVRVERIQSISHDDAIAEGIDLCNSSVGWIVRERIQRLWEAVYPGSWARNEWVWAVTFKRVCPAG